MIFRYSSGRVVPYVIQLITGPLRDQVYRSIEGWYNVMIVGPRGSISYGRASNLTYSKKSWLKISKNGVVVNEQTRITK